MAVDARAVTGSIEATGELQRAGVYRLDAKVGEQIQEGRVASAGCILPLTLRDDLPEGVGTRHRAAVGITEETDALVIVVSEETGAISVVLGGEMRSDLTVSQLRTVLRTILSGERRDLPPTPESGEEAVSSEEPSRPTDRARARWGR